MNIRYFGMAAMAVAMALSLGGCKKDTPKVSETEQLRRYNEARFNDLDSKLTALDTKMENPPAPSTGASITDIGGPAIIEPQPRSKKQMLNDLGGGYTAAPSKPAKAARPAKSSGDKTIMVSGVAAKDVQRALAKAGFNPGKADGKIGPNTIKAIKQFQSAEGLKADGVVGPATWARLRKHLR